MSTPDESTGMFLDSLIKSVSQPLAVSFCVMIVLMFVFFTYHLFEKVGSLNKARRENSSPLAYKSPNGKGYWVKGIGEGNAQYSFVSFRELYPEGTDMDELRKLKMQP